MSMFKNQSKVDADIQTDVYVLTNSAEQMTFTTTILWVNAKKLV